MLTFYSRPPEHCILLAVRRRRSCWSHPWCLPHCHFFRVLWRGSSQLLSLQRRKLDQRW
jgi:hypothetical protein